jgi:hypothetical protein
MPVMAGIENLRRSFPTLSVPMRSAASTADFMGDALSDKMKLLCFA